MKHHGWRFSAFDEPSNERDHGFWVPRRSFKLDGEEIDIGIYDSDNDFQGFISGLHDMKPNVGAVIEYTTKKYRTFEPAERALFQLLRQVVGKRTANLIVKAQKEQRSAEAWLEWFEK